MAWRAKQQEKEKKTLRLECEKLKTTKFLVHLPSLTIQEVALSLF
jgi:hypothetical protein